MEKSTPQNISKRPQRERLFSAPERLQKSKNEKREENFKKMTLLKTRQRSDGKLDKISEENHFEDLDEMEILKKSKNFNAEKYKCQICSKKFFHRNALDAHFLVHSMENINITVTSPLSLKSQKISPISSPVSEKCSICKKKFSSKSSLKIHKNKFHAESANFTVLAVL